MVRLQFVNTSRFGIMRWKSIAPIQNTVSRYPIIWTRNIAVLTEDMKKDAEIHGGLKSMDSLPGPRTFPILGNLEHIRTKFMKMHITQLKNAKKYGPMYKDKLFRNNVIIVQDSNICKEVYRAEGKLPHRDFSISLREFLKAREKMQLPKSLLDLNGEEWAELRRKFHKKMLAPINMKMFYPQFSDVAVDAVECIRRLRDENSIINDVREEVLGKWALESIGKFVYGFRTGLLDQTLTDENKRFYEGIKIVLTNAIFLSRAKWLKYIFWKAYADLNKGMKDWHAIGMKNTKKVMEQVKNAEEMGKTLEDSIANSLTCYLILTKNMDFNECSVHAIELFGAGYDTTSITTSWVLHWLGMNPDKQEILYNEVIDRIPEDGRITDAAVQRMPYLRACIKESARLTPMIFVNMRSFPEDMVLRDYIIPAQTPILLSNYNMGRDESIFPNANSFMPERWLRENKEEDEIHPFTTLPFGFGARSCLGRRIAEAEMQVFLAQVVRQLKIKYIGEEQEGDNIFGITLPKSTFAFYDR